MSTDGRAIATSCEVNSGEYSSFSEHPASACNSGNFWPTSKCSEPPPRGQRGAHQTHGAVERVVMERNVTDMAGGGPYTRIEHLSEALGYDSPFNAWNDQMSPAGTVWSHGFLTGQMPTAELLYPVLTELYYGRGGSIGPDDLTANLYGSGTEDAYGPWIWNEYINQWVMEGSDLNPRAVIRCSSGSGIAMEATSMSDAEADVLAEILEDHYADMYGHPALLLSDAITKCWSRFKSAGYGDKFNQTVLIDYIHSWTGNGVMINNLNSNFMTISKEPYTTADGDDFFVYGSVSDFVFPTVQQVGTHYGYSFGTGGDADSFIGETEGESFSGKKYDIHYSDMERAGLRYLFGFPAQYTGNSRRQDYINDRLDVLAEDILLSDLIYSFTYNRKRTPILSRNSFEAFPAQVTPDNLTIETMAESAITPSVASMGALRDALAAALARLRPMETDAGEAYDYSSLSDADLAGSDYVAIGSPGTSGGMGDGGSSGGGYG